MALLLAIPIALQALAMGVDEGHFHRRRGLPRWERIGHPLDTLTVLACYAFLLVFAPSRAALVAYVALAALSSAFITKDEPIHARRCTPSEHWLHAVLFVLHPVVLAAIALLWPALHGAPLAWPGDGRAARAVFYAAFACTAFFGAFQAAYWNLPWPRMRRSAR